MSDPYDTPAGRWGLIFHGSGMYQPARSRQVWAQIADAIGTADLLREGQPGVRGDDAWCVVATDTYRRLHDAGAYAHLRPGDKPHWYADSDLIQAWLHAPIVAAGDEPSTMLDEHGWQFAFDPARTPDPADLTMLVGLAQAAGVVGAPDHKVSLLRWVDNGVTRDDSFLVLLWPPNGPARASCAVSRDTLLPPAPSTMDTIIGMFTAVASVANTLITATNPAESRGDATRPPTSHDAPSSRGRAFRVLDPATTPGPAISAPTLRPVPSDQPTSRRRRT